MAKGRGGFIGQDGLNAPDSPTGVSGTAGDAQVEVSWTAPSNVGESAITGYNVVANDGTRFVPPLFSYTNKSFSLQSQDNEPWKIAFKPDGTKMYLAGGNTTTLYQYALSTAWDISTASYESKSYGFSSQVNFPRGLAFNSDGTKVFIGGYSNATSDNRMFQYSLSTAWDISTASYDSVNFSFASQISSMQDVKFKPDGTKMYAVKYDASADEVVYQYALSSAYDLSTASYESKSLTLGTNEVYIAFTSDGATLYTGNFSEVVTQYSLSTPWDVSTGTATGTTFSLASQLTSLTGIELKPDDLTFYAQGQDTDTIFQYLNSEYPLSSPVTITGLTNGTSYTFNVWAINAFGWSVASDPSGSVTPANPETAIFTAFYDGTTYSNIDAIDIKTTGNATDFGDLNSAVYAAGGCASSTRGVIGGGNGAPYDMQYVTFASAGNALDFGDLSPSFTELAGLSNSTRGVWAGAYQAAMDYITIASTGNSVDFGNLNVSVGGNAGFASSTRGVWSGGYNGGVRNEIQYITIASTGNASDFGDLTVARDGVSGASSSTRGLSWCGRNSGNSRTNIIDYVTIASTGNATDFGDATRSQWYGGAVAGSTRAVGACGNEDDGTPYSNVMDYVTIASTGNATDFGDLTGTYGYATGASSAHGGL